MLCHYWGCVSVFCSKGARGLNPIHIHPTEPRNITRCVCKWVQRQQPAVSHQHYITHGHGLVFPLPIISTTRPCACTPPGRARTYTRALQRYQGFDVHKACPVCCKRFKSVCGMGGRGESYSHKRAQEPRGNVLLELYRQREEEGERREGGKERERAMHVGSCS